ncbi:uncharacterized protein EAE97_010667 [Botrytis byssoidea]|uniref:Potassium transport protein n=1 Tax=Botrytis byssoidea TaxID=139641 RepID=A0A9P5HVT0_9HELO|nr:uncharacterized protein EAE97_010667 [Botrytis byssoidea]KAF7924716.1 hypothetical protein EAE97_010667 [Botrytis byssoidea]
MTGEHHTWQLTSGETTARNSRELEIGHHGAYDRHEERNVKRGIPKIVIPHENETGIYTLDTKSEQRKLDASKVRMGEGKVDTEVKESRNFESRNIQSETGRLEVPKLQTVPQNHNSQTAPRTFGSFFAIHSPIATRPLKSLLPSRGHREKTLPRSMRGSFFNSHPSREEMGKKPRSLKSFMGDEWYDRVMRCLSPILALLPPLNFITIHYTYFIITLLITSLIFWGSSNPSKSISYVDSLFLVTSAMTEAGLNTVNLSTMTTFQQVILWLLIVVGSAIFVSVATVRTRKRAFEVRFGEVVGRHKEERRRERIRSGSRDAMGSRRGDGNDLMGANWKFPSTSGGNRGDDALEMDEGLKVQPVGGRSDDNCMTAISEISPHGGVPKDTGDHITFAPDAYPVNGKGKAKDVTGGSSNNETATPARSTNFQFPTSTSENTIKHRVQETSTLQHTQTGQQDLAPLQYPSYLNSNTTGRNAQFHGLSRAEREHLGGVEYRAISFLAWLVPLYFILWQVLGGIGLGAYMAYNKSNVALENGINPWWLGVFNAISAFNNSGMSLLDLNMIPFQTSVYTLLTMGLLILAGNTAYPLFLRLILYTLLKLLDTFPNLLSPFQHHKPTLLFILRYPRRVYTNLFPSRPTWWLLFMVITLNSIDWVAFELLNIGNSATQVIEPRYRVLDGLFQAIAVRSGGFYIISIPSLRIGLQFLYVVMMYISVYPVVITMRHSNVYEERSLGIYRGDVETDSNTTRWGRGMKRIRKSISGRDIGIPRTASSNSNLNSASSPKEETTGTQFVRHQLRSQLSHDLWWLTLATFLIVCIEGSSFERDPITYSVFNVIFEVVSAYGCVGISTGLPDQDYSFSGGMKKASKVVLVAVMVRGRHRGLPRALDRAVRLPGWEGEGLGGEGGGEREEGLGMGEFGEGGKERDDGGKGKGRERSEEGRGLRKRRFSRGVVGNEEV